jgi:hypothetical protein
MKKVTNYAAGPRGITMKDGADTVWLKPGASAEIDPAKVAVMPDLGDKPKAERDEDAEALKSALDENADLKKQIATLQADLEKANKPAK